MSKIPSVFVASLSLLFAFPEYQVHKTTNQSRGEADPRQDVGGAEGAFLKRGLMKTLVLSRVDGRCDQRT